MEVDHFRQLGECGNVSLGMAVTSFASWEPPVENNDWIHNGAYKGHLWEKPYPTACWEWGAIAADVGRTIRQQMPPKQVFSMSQAHISKSSIKEKPNVEEEWKHTQIIVKDLLLKGEEVNHVEIDVHVLTTMSYCVSSLWLYHDEDLTKTIPVGTGWNFHQEKSIASFLCERKLEHFCRHLQTKNTQCFFNSVGPKHLLFKLVSRMLLLKVFKLVLVPLHKKYNVKNEDTSLHTETNAQLVTLSNLGSFSIGLCDISVQIICLGLRKRYREIHTTKTLMRTTSISPPVHQMSICGHNIRFQCFQWA